MKLLRPMGLVAIIKIFAKISALFRDRAIALTLGMGAGADMFLLGSHITSGFRGIVADDSLKAAFLPLYTEAYEEHRHTMWRFVNTVVNIVFVGLILLSLVWFGIVPWIVALMGGGVALELQQIATTTARLLAITLVFGGASTLGVTILTVMGRFALPASLPLIMNVCIILVSLLLHSYWGPHAVALGVVLGSVCQVAVQVPLLYRCGYRYRPLIQFTHPLLRQLLPLFIPVMGMQAILQLNILVDTAFAAGLETGSISYLYYGNRVMLFPYDIVAMAVTMVAFPALAKSATHHNLHELTQVLDTALGMVLFFSIPAMLGGIVLAQPIIQTIFGDVMQHASAVSGTARALMYYLMGLPVFIAVRVLLPVFYSFKDTRTPLIIGVLCLGLNVFLNYVLAARMEYVGLALSSALAAGIHTLLLVLVLYRRHVVPSWKFLGRSFVQVSLGAIVTSAVVWWMVEHIWSHYSVLLQALGGVTVGIVLYLGMMYLFGNKQFAMILAAVKEHDA